MNVTRTIRALLYRKSGVYSVNTRYKSSAQYCLDIVKQYDYENFASTILLKSSARSSAFAVRSFNVEISKVAEQVTQETIGLMRLKFWEETLDKCFSKDFKNVPQHPVAVELFKAIESSKLSKRYFNNLIQSRKDHLKVLNMKTIEDMEKYAEASVSSVYYLLLEGCNVRNVNADHAATHLGKSQGIVQQLRGLPHAKQLNTIGIPQEILIKYSVSQEEILRSKSSNRLNDCVFDVATRAHQHLTKSRSLTKEVPPEGRCALLPAVVVSSYLDRLQKVDYDVFHPSLKHRSWKLLSQLWLTRFKNKY